MIEHPLTLELISRAQSRTMPYALNDGEGLYLWVTPTAGKLWRWNYTYGGQGRVMAYGEWPRLGLERARTEHRKAQKLLAQGIDPMSWKRAQDTRAKHLRMARQEEKRLLKELQDISHDGSIATDTSIDMLRTA